MLILWAQVGSDLPKGGFLGPPEVLVLVSQTPAAPASLWLEDLALGDFLFK